MRTIRSAGAVALTLALLVAACGAKQHAPSENQQAMGGTSAKQPSKNIYSGTGTVQSITGDQAAIAHGPIAGIGWPAMTMTFTVPAGMANDVKVGAKVDFSFQKNGSAYVLTSVKPQ